MSVLSPPLLISTLIALSVPDPSRVVPAARLGHVADVRVKPTSLRAGLAPAGSATTRAITKIAGTKASRLIENLLSLPSRVIHPRLQRLSTAKSRRCTHRGQARPGCAGEKPSIPAAQNLHHDRAGSGRNPPSRRVSADPFDRDHWTDALAVLDDRDLRGVGADELVAELPARREAPRELGTRLPLVARRCVGLV